MSKKMWYSLMAVLMVTMLVLSACGPAATEAPRRNRSACNRSAATEAPPPKCLHRSANRSSSYRSARCWAGGNFLMVGWRW